MHADVCSDCDGEGVCNMEAWLGFVRGVELITR